MSFSVSIRPCPSARSTQKLEMMTGTLLTEDWCVGNLVGEDNKMSKTCDRTSRQHIVARTTPAPHAPKEVIKEATAKVP